MKYKTWPVVIPADLADEWATYGAGTRQRAEDLARQVMFTLTGQRFGTITATVRPCFQPADVGRNYRGAGHVFWPGLLNGAPNAVGPCGCSPQCTEVGYDRLALPGPVHEVVSVMIDGVLVDETAYRVDHRRWLHRIDGQRWPKHQDLHAADDAVGAFTIVYLQGLPVPDPGPEMAGLLAVEFARGMQSGSCKLPDRATSVSRQGVSVELADIREWFTNGLTGIEQVDLWIMAVNPYKSRRPARITSPESVRERRAMVIR
ncbi:hypothetical protein C6V83_18080 [Gordonia iterans]|uniref:Head-to-tail adaptor n=1 Tax=Gordonia iterans TaxID=1004901 RepID=A0A2S0KJN1_9ACTN|nr:hypothetical protein [Gordonia iterans]AVM01887.1 hypothetical protein C6V83_18080 [Gordonia iterans]